MEHLLMQGWQQVEILVKMTGPKMYFVKKYNWVNYHDIWSLWTFKINNRISLSDPKVF